jgi:NRPS condensation-like uncharacterized protein
MCDGSLKMDPQLLSIPRFTRKLVHRERLFFGGYSANISIVVRLKGNVSQDRLRSVIQHMPYRHPLLQVRIIQDEQGVPWFTSEGCPDVKLEVYPRSSDSQWIATCYRDYHYPFRHAEGPHAKFTLLYSPSISELVITIHHIIGDGMSLGYLVRDILDHLADPTKGYTHIIPPTFSLEQIPIPPHIDFLTKFILKRYNVKWRDQKIKYQISFDAKDMVDVHEIFVANYQPIFSNLQLSETETTAFLHKCRQEGVTVNSALLTLLLLVQQQYLQLDPHFRHRTIIPVNIRDRLRTPVGEGFGLYASGYNLTYRYNWHRSFWDNVLALHKRIMTQMTDHNIFKDLVLMYHFMDPSLMGDMKYFLMGRLVNDTAKYAKLSKLAQQKDLVVNTLIKKKRLDTGFTHEVVLTNIGNLDRVHLKRTYGPLVLDSIMFAPGSNPRMRLAIGTVTASGKLNLNISSMSHIYSQEQLDELRELITTRLDRDV